jgi:hypothetical protein
MLDYWVEASGVRPFDPRTKMMGWDKWKWWLHFVWGYADKIWDGVHPQLAGEYQKHLANPGIAAFAKSLWRWKLIESGLWLAQERRYGFSQHERVWPLASEVEPEHEFAAYAFEAYHAVKLALPVLSDASFDELFRWALTNSLCSYFAHPVPSKLWRTLLPALREEAEQMETDPRDALRQAVEEALVTLHVPPDYRVGYLLKLARPHVVRSVMERFLGEEFDAEHGVRKKYGFAPRHEDEWLSVEVEAFARGEERISRAERRMDSLRARTQLTDYQYEALLAKYGKTIQPTAERLGKKAGAVHKCAFDAEAKVRRWVERFGVRLTDLDNPSP